MHIAVLLATYNSSKYLSAQIDSILNQTIKNVNIYIFDDGSSDNTIQIIDTYLNNFTNIVFFNNSIKFSSPIKSFIWLLDNVSSDYYLFSDHDDIWIENKIEISLNKINEVEKSNPKSPILVHTDLIVVDKYLNIINNSFWSLSKIKPNVLNCFNYLSVHNGVVGCTMIFNDLAKKSILPINDNSLMHDSWITLCVLNNNGIIDYLESPTVYYRQHHDNVIGYVKPNTFLSLLSYEKFSSIICNNYYRFKMVNQIKKFSLFKYFRYKLFYFFK